jgi:hypothetical protein
MPLQVPYSVKQPTEVKPSTSASFMAMYDDNLPLFCGSPNLADIAQGSIADCFFLASLLAILHRPNGQQYIDNIMVEDTRRKTVTVRLYEALGRPIYLRTRKCRVRNVGANAPVSMRTCCWPDVLEVCASMFSMKTAFDVPQKTANPSLDNLNLGAPQHALSILTGKNVETKEIPDVRLLDTDKNFGYGFIKALIDESHMKTADDKKFRADCVEEGSGKPWPRTGRFGRPRTRPRSTTFYSRTRGTRAAE